MGEDVETEEERRCRKGESDDRVRERPRCFSTVEEDKRGLQDACTGDADVVFCAAAGMWGRGIFISV